jgi:hypothetical protein
VTKHFRTLAVALVFALASTVMGRAQDKPTPAPPRPAGAVMPLKIQVVISRYQGEKKISSLPYTLSVNSTSTNPADIMNGSHASLRMGAKVPVTMMATPAVDGKPIPGVATAGPFQYQDVGTNIDCYVWPMDEGRFRVAITVDDSSVYADDKEPAGATKGSPTFRSFRASDSIILKDGGTAQFTTATDKVSGEVVKVDVTLTVVK